MILIPKQEDTAPSAGSRTMREGAKPKPTNISSRLLVDVVELGLLNACNVAVSIREEGVNSVLSALVIQHTCVPVSD
jgi:hypothetical protein